MTTTEQLAAALRALLDEAPAGTIAESVLYDELRGMHDALTAAREALARYDAERAAPPSRDTGLAAALEAATDALSALAMRASCAPNDDSDAADRELGKIMREAYAARDAAASALNTHRNARAQLSDDGRLLADLAAPLDDTQAACAALAAVHGYERIDAALACLADVPTACLVQLARHPARLDSLRTVARVLGSLPAAQAVTP